jgi:hypothetical protein
MGDPGGARLRLNCDWTALIVIRDNVASRVVSNLKIMITCKMIFAIDAPAAIAWCDLSHERRIMRRI